MTPIINPWIFYWMKIADDVCFITGLAVILSAIALLIVGIVCVMDCELMEEEEARVLKKTAIIFGAIFVISIAISIFVPNSTVITRMMIASYATPDNVNSLVTQIMDAAKEVLSVVK